MRFKFRSSRHILLVFVVFIGSGCAALSLRTTMVTFEDPYARLNIVPTEPNEKEKAGIELRVPPPAKRIEKSREETTLYAMIKNGKGAQLKFILDRTDMFKPGSQSDSYILYSETIFQGEKGSLMEEKEMTNRGEIIKFVRGFHHSKIGNFRIIDWGRTPIFPSGAVKIGDTWSYDERMFVQIESMWIKEIKPQPYVMKATSKLEGFVLVNGTRCAVIKTGTTQSKREDFKIFFKEVAFNIYTQIEETVFLDYATGTMIAKITHTRSNTVGANVPLDETGESQSIFFTTDN